MCATRTRGDRWSPWPPPSVSIVTQAFNVPGREPIVTRPLPPSLFYRLPAVDSAPTTVATSCVRLRVWVVPSVSNYPLPSLLTGAASLDVHPSSWPTDLLASRPLYWLVWSRWTLAVRCQNRLLGLWPVSFLSVQRFLFTVTVRLCVFISWWKNWWGRGSGDGAKLYLAFQLSWHAFSNLHCSVQRPMLYGSVNITCAVLQ